MVKSIINVRRFLDMLAWSEDDNGHQKTRNHGYDVIVGGELLLGLDHPRKLVAPYDQNSNLLGAGTLQTSFIGGITASSLA